MVVVLEGDRAGPAGAHEFRHPRRGGGENRAR